MADLNTLQTRIDAWLDANIWPVVQSTQDAYVIANGRYWQGQITHNALPAHTIAADNDIPGDNLADTPSDLVESWLDKFPALNGVNMPCSAKINIYDGPAGTGYVVELRFTHEGTEYVRVRNFGPETYRETPWTEVVL